MSNIRRFCTSLMALVLTTGTFVSYPIGNQTVKADTLAVSNDFETTYNGWVSTGNLVNVVATQEGGYQSNRGLKVSNRQTQEDGISSEKGFYLDGGIEYNYSFMVKSLGNSTETVKISLTYTYEDTGKVETVDLITNTVNANEWVELSTDYKTPKGTIGHTITITTDSTSDFCLDNVKITEKSAQNYTVDATSSEYGLKDVYSNYFKFGTCLPSMELQDSTAMALVLKEFNSITCENEMKPDATIDKSKSTDTNIAVSLSSCASILDFCVQNNIAVRGHTLIWHSQTPTWFFKENFDSNGAWVSKDVMDKRMESYIKNMFEAIKTQYPTLNLYAYDVANECISDGAVYGNPSTYCRTAGANTGNGYSPWVQIYGDNSFVEKAFTYARKYAPSGCKLFYNDYNEYMGDKMLAIKDMVQDLYNKGLLDGMGMQSHLDTTWPSAEGYKTALDLYNSIGCEIQVTELDIATPNGDETAHAQRYKEIMQAILDTYNNGHNITAVCVWGTTDKYSWRDEDVLLFDDNYQAKQSYSEIFNLGTIPSNPNTDNNTSSGSYYFHDTFDGSISDWSARGNSTVGLSGRMPYSGTDALVISNRSAVWNGVQKSLDTETFKSGNEYSFSVFVNYLDSDVDTETFYLTLQYTDQNGNTKYENIDTKTVTKGEYTQLSNTNFKIPSDVKDMKLVVESATQTMNFYIDEAMGASAGTVYGTQCHFHDEFESTDFDWSARGNSTVGLSGRMPYSGSNALVISNRSAVWSGVQKSLDTETFKSGKEYGFSVFVTYLDSDSDTETFYLTLQYTDQNGNTKYENIDTKTVTKGEYTELSNSNFKIPSDVKDMKLVVESATQTMNFYIDEATSTSTNTGTSSSSGNNSSTSDNSNSTDNSNNNNTTETTGLIDLPVSSSIDVSNYTNKEIIGLKLHFSSVSTGNGACHLISDNGNWLGSADYNLNNSDIVMIDLSSYSNIGSLDIYTWWNSANATIDSIQLITKSSNTTDNSSN